MTYSGPAKVEQSIGTPPVDPIPVVGWRELLWWILRRRRRFRVSGNSMLPLLAPDDEVLIDPKGSVGEGDIVIARHPYRDDVIWVKCLKMFDELGQAHLEGLNPAESTDSRSQGAVPRDLIIGRVTSRF